MATLGATPSTTTFPAAPTLAAVLAVGNDTGGTAIVLDKSDDVESAEQAITVITDMTGDVASELNLTARSADSTVKARLALYADGTNEDSQAILVADAPGVTALVQANVASGVANVIINDGTSTGAAGDFLGSDGAGNTTWQEPPTQFVSYATLVAALSGLVHRWKFEDVSGDFADSVGSLTLTASGAFTYAVAGGPVSGGAGSVTFGASGKGTSTGLGSIPIAGGARTFLLVYKGKAATAKACFWSYGTGATRAWFTAFINDGVQDTMSMSVFGAGQDVAQTLTPGNMETWHLLAGVYDGVQTSSLFIDGRVAAIRHGAALNTTNSGNFQIGLDISGSNQLLAATFDDLAILTVALDHYTIQRLYNALAGGLS